MNWGSGWPPGRRSGIGIAATAPAWKVGGFPTAERVQLLSRRNCPLCESAHEVLIELAAARRLGVSEYDIDADPLLQPRFTDRVPVILYQGRVLAEGRVNRNRLREALDEIAEGHRVDPDDSVTEAGSQPDRG